MRKRGRRVDCGMKVTIEPGQMWFHAYPCGDDAGGYEDCLTGVELDPGNSGSCDPRRVHMVVGLSHPLGVEANDGNVNVMTFSRCGEGVHVGGYSWRGGLERFIGEFVPYLEGEL